MTDSLKKALLIFGGGGLIFLIFRPKSINFKKMINGGATSVESPSKRKPLKEPKVDPAAVKGNKKAQDAMLALSAYVKAYNAGETQKNLDELNKELAKEFSLNVFQRGLDKKIVVSNLSGKVILEHNG